MFAAGCYCQGTVTPGQPLCQSRWPQPVSHSAASLLWAHQAGRALQRAGREAMLAPKRHAVVPPTQTQLLLISQGTVTPPVSLALVTSSAPDPPEVSALPGGVDKHAELGANIQPAASDGDSGSSSLWAIQGSYGVHHRKLETREGESCFLAW